MWYEEMSGAFPQLTKFVPSIGKSLEGRDMPALHITATGGGEEVNKIYFQCQIHASEEGFLAHMNRAQPPHHTSPSPHFLGAYIQVLHLLFTRY